MNKLKVIKIEQGEIVFSNGVSLFGNHEQECCENHDLTTSDLTMSDFDGLEFDLTNDNFFKRIPDYGIELIPIHGHSVKIPAHGYNNGYYSSELELVIGDGKGFTKTYDITDCQEIQY